MCENLIPLKFEACAVLETFELLQCWSPELHCAVNLEKAYMGSQPEDSLKYKY